MKSYIRFLKASQEVSSSGTVFGASMMEQIDSTTLTGNSTSSGDESSEDNWLPNWSLNLYNALNPTVITTGEFVNTRNFNEQEYVST